MENNQVKIFVPRSGASAFSNANEKKVDTPASNNSENPNKSHTIIKDGMEIDSRFWPRFFKGLGYFFVGMVVGTGVFVGVYLLLSRFFALDYILKSIIALLFAALLGKGFSDTTGGMKTLVSGATTVFIIIAFVSSLLYGSEYGTVGKNNFNIEQFDQINSEFGTVGSVGEIWRTTKSYKAGTNVKLRIRGSSVKILNGKTLEPSDYNIPILSDGTIAFEGVSDTPSKIEVVQ